MRLIEIITETIDEEDRKFGWLDDRGTYYSDVIEYRGMEEQVDSHEEILNGLIEAQILVVPDDYNLSLVDFVLHEGWIRFSAYIDGAFVHLDVSAVSDRALTNLYRILANYKSEGVYLDLENARDQEGARQDFNYRSAISFIRKETGS